MTLSNFKRHIKPVLIITLLAVLALAVTGCEEFGFPPVEPAEETEEVEVLPPTTITTEDRAILAVHEHLFTLAESHQAKIYLADFYATCDAWNADSELFKDGTTVWYVVVSMRRMEVREDRPHWEQACWLVFRDGRVVPSRRSQANALIIEADLQELSLQDGVVGSEFEGSNGE